LHSLSDCGNGRAGSQHPARQSSAIESHISGGGDCARADPFDSGRSNVDVARSLRVAITVLTVAAHQPYRHCARVARVGSRRRPDFRRRKPGAADRVARCSDAKRAAAFGTPFRIYATATTLILVVFGVMAGTNAPDVEANLPTPWLGVWERISIGVDMLWVAVLAIALLCVGGGARECLHRKQRWDGGRSNRPPCCLSTPQRRGRGGLRRPSVQREREECFAGRSAYPRNPGGARRRRQGPRPHLPASARPAESAAANVRPAALPGLDTFRDRGVGFPARSVAACRVPHEERP
jgi:hypothetical protein